jgi:hypothetical protein
MPATLEVSLFESHRKYRIDCTPLVLKKEDVLKVDIGVHVRGRILDSAFTLTFEPTYNELLEAVKAATNTGIQVFTPGHVWSSSEGFTIGGWNRRATWGDCRSDTRDYGVV